MWMKHIEERKIKYIESFEYIVVKNLVNKKTQ